MAKDSPNEKSHDTAKPTLDDILPELTPEQCRRSHGEELESLGIKSTEDVLPFIGTLGHPRAMMSIEDGLDTPQPEYNLWITGASKGHEKTVTERILQSEYSKNPDPKDYVWVWNPDAMGKEFQTLEFNPGEGKLFAEDLADLADNLKLDIPGILTDPDYVELNKNYEAMLLDTQDKYMGMFKARGIVVSQQGPAFMNAETPEGIELAAKLRGELDEESDLTDQDLINNFANENLDKVTEIQNLLAEEFEVLDNQYVPQKEELFKRIAGAKVFEAFQHIIEKYDALDATVFFTKAQNYLMDNLDVFLPDSEFGDPAPMAMSLGGMSLGGMPQGPDPVDEVLSVLNAKVGVEHSTTDTEVPHIIVEDDPTYENVFGKQAVSYGVTVSGGGKDIGLEDLRAGSLVEAAAAGPCYYVFHFERVASQPLVWEKLKRAIETRKVKIKNPEGGSLYLMDVDELEMEDLDLEDVKFIMLGSEAYDAYLRTNAFIIDSAWVQENFVELASFERTAEEVETQDLAGQVATICKARGLKHLDDTGLDIALGTLYREAGDQGEISTKFDTRGLTAVLIEADREARREDAEIVTGNHVQAALDRRRYKLGIGEDYFRKHIKKGLKRVKLEEEVVGQGTGLAVMQGLDLAFGVPGVVSASVCMGSGVFPNILGKVGLAGSTQKLGHEEMAVYLKGVFAQDMTLPFEMNVLLEESYGPLDGNSASAVSYVTCISELSEAPMLMRRAMTGACMSKGYVTAIGGENLKIEGFYWTLKEMGMLDKYDDCGVVIPACNAQGLQLHPEIADAMEEGKFHIWPVDHVDQAAYWLMGCDKEGAKQVGDLETPGTIYGDAYQRSMDYLRKKQKMGKLFDEEKPVEAPEEESGCGGCGGCGDK